MTQSYKQIQKQIATLQRKAEKLRKQELKEEIDGVVARIKVAIEHYGITAEQLGFGVAAGSVRKNAKAGRAVAPARAVKYSDGQGNSWSGIGKRPYWLRDALDAGRTLEEFAVNASSSGTKSARLTTSKKKRKSKVVYRDQAGHTWSGMGPRPRWLKEALDSGKTLEEMSA